MRRQLHKEWARFYWHGCPWTFDDFLDRPVTDRYLQNEALTELIEISNEQGGGRPKDER